MSDTDFATIDYFRDRDLPVDPYPFYEWVRSQGPVWYYPLWDVYLITGYQEVVQVYHDQENWSNCNTVSGPFVKMSVPLEGDDITPIIEAHRDELPFSDQLPSFDPPKHTAHRGLLMRLITPKRLKEREEYLWELADSTIDGFIDRGECELLHDYAIPYTLLVIADLLGVPDEDREEMLDHLVHKVRVAKMEHKPLGYLYDQFTRYIEDRRAKPRDDVMTEMAQATFPDGTLPSVDDVMRIAANLFSAGSETTARLIVMSLRTLGDHPEFQKQLRDDHSPDLPVHRGDAPDRGSAEGLVQAVEGPHHGRGRRDAAGNHRVRDDRRREPRPPPVRMPGGVPPRPAEWATAPRVRPRYPLVRGCPARSGGDARHPRAVPRADVRHPDLGSPPRPARARGPMTTTARTCSAA